MTGHEDRLTKDDLLFEDLSGFKSTQAEWTLYTAGDGLRGVWWGDGLLKQMRNQRPLYWLAFCMITSTVIKCRNKSIELWQTSYYFSPNRHHRCFCYCELNGAWALPETSGIMWFMVLHHPPSVATWEVDWLDKDQRWQAAEGFKTSCFLRRCITHS